MNENGLQLTQILHDLEGKSPSFVDSYLRKLSGVSKTIIESVKQVLDADQNCDSIDFKAIVGNSSNEIISSFNPQEYIGKEYSEWVATGVIKTTAKSIILKGETKEKKFTQNVAIKISLPLLSTVSGEGHTSKQAHFMSNLVHLNIVQHIFSGTTEDGVNFIVMELLTDDNIVQYSIKNKLTLRERLTLFGKACDAVQYMHRHGVVHQDLKPQNILMNSEGEPKIIDFDLSSANKNFDDGYNYPNLEGHTNYYASPEQLKNLSLPSTLSDIYSLGKVFQELIFEKIENLENVNLEYLISKYGKNYRYPELIAIFRKSIAEKPENRYAISTEMNSDLQRFKHGSLIAKAYFRQAKKSYRINHWIKSNTVTLALGFIVSSVLLTTLGIILQANQEQNDLFRLYVKSQDPTQVQETIELERRGMARLKGQGILTDTEWYNDLISLGDVFYGKGQATKAIAYYQKALDIYPSVSNPKRVYATEKLIHAYWVLEDISEVERLFKTYENDILDPKLYKPEYINLFFTYLKVQDSFFKPILPKYQTFQMDVNVGEFIASLPLDHFPTKEAKEFTRAMALYEKANYDYRQLPADLASVTPIVSQEEYEKDLVPVLRNSIKLMEESLLILSNYPNEKTSLSRVQLGIAYVHSELSEINLARGYSQIALTDIIEIFGQKHVYTEFAYRKIHGMFRFNDIELAETSVNKALEISKLRGKNLFYFFNLQLKIEHLFRLGKRSEGKKVFEIMRSDFRSLEDPHSFIVAVMASTYWDIVDGALFYNDAPHHYYEEFIELERNYPDAHNHNDLSLTDVDYASFAMKTAFNKMPEEEAKSLIADRIKFLMKSLDPEYYFSYYLYPIKQCTNIPTCDQVALVETAFSLELSNDIDKKYSLYRLGDYIGYAHIYALSGKPKESEMLLNEVSHIFTRVPEKGAVQSLYWFTKGLNAFETPKQAKEYLDKAYYMALEEFSKDSEYVQQIFDKLIVVNKQLKR